MKLRIKDDSVRLRLDQRDIECLAREGSVEASTRFPGGSSLLYAVRSERGGVEMHAAFDGGSIVITLPAGMVADWVGSDRVGFEASVPTNAGTLRVLVEKDFACLAPREGEDDSNAYPHPQAGDPDASC